MRCPVALQACLSRVCALTVYGRILAKLREMGYGPEIERMSYHEVCFFKEMEGVAHESATFQAR